MISFTNIKQYCEWVQSEEYDSDNCTEVSLIEYFATLEDSGDMFDNQFHSLLSDMCVTRSSYYVEFGKVISLMSRDFTDESMRRKQLMR